jgi:hypothetical protein
MISRLIYLPITIISLLTLSQLSYSSESVNNQYNQRSIVEIESSEGNYYAIRDHIDKYVDDTNFRLYQIISLRAKDQLLKKFQKKDKNLDNKIIILNGFKKAKCWWVENRYFCDFLVPVKGVSFKSKEPSINFKSYLKSLDLFDSISVVDFNDKRYVVSLTSDEVTGLRPIDKLNLKKSTKLLAESELIKFSKGENIVYDLSYTEKTTTTTTTASETKSITVKVLNEVIKSKSSGVVKDFSYMWYISNGLIFHYAYIEIPKD